MPAVAEFSLHDLQFVFLHEQLVRKFLVLILQKLKLSHQVSDFQRVSSFRSFKRSLGHILPIQQVFHLLGVGLERAGLVSGGNDLLDGGNLLSRDFLVLVYPGHFLRLLKLHLLKLLESEILNFLHLASPSKVLLHARHHLPLLLPHIETLEVLDFQ